jgi:hypothetical protein
LVDAVVQCTRVRTHVISARRSQSGFDPSGRKVNANAPETITRESTAQSAVNPTPWSTWRKRYRVNERFGVRWAGSTQRSNPRDLRQGITKVVSTRAAEGYTRTHPKRSPARARRKAP